MKETIDRYRWLHEVTLTLMDYDMYPIGSFDKGQGHQFNSMLGPNGLAFFQTLHILLPTTLILHKSHRRHGES